MKDLSVPKCKLHHNGPCGKCHNCGKPGHYACECRNASIANTGNRDGPRGNGKTPRVSGCFECGVQGHFKKDFPKLKNKNGTSEGTQARVYAVVKAEDNPDSNVMTGTFLLN